MRRFELVEGKSSKFWEIALEGTSVTVRFGRIGTNGQVQEKSFPSEEKAKSHHDKLVAEKVKKGYAEVAAGDAPMPAPTSKKVEPEAVEPAPVAEPPVSEPTSLATLVAPAGPIVATDPSTWPAELRAELLPTRAWPGAPIALDRKAIWKKLRERSASTKTGSKGLDAGKARLESTAPPGELAAPEVELAVARLVSEAPRAYLDSKWVIGGVELAIDHWVATGGVAAALPLAVRIAVSGLESFTFAAGAIWQRLLRHVVHASEEEWTRARDAMIELAAHPVQGRVSLAAALAFLFPETGEGDRLVLGATPGQHGYTNLDPLAVAAITRLDALVSFAQHGNAYYLRTGGAWRNASSEPTLLVLVARFAEDVIDPFLALMEREYTDAESTRAIARAIGLVSSPRAFEVLAARATEKHVVVGLRDAALRAPEVALGPLARAASGRSAAAQAVRAILAQIVRARDLSEAEAALPDAVRGVIAEVRARGGADREEASLDEIPAVIASPPWLTKKTKKVEAQVIGDVAPLPWIDTMVWPAGVREKWRAYQASQWMSQQAHQVHQVLHVSEELVPRLEREEPAAIEALRTAPRNYYYQVHGPVLLHLPLGLARSIVIALAEQRFWEGEATLEKLAAEHELAFLDPILAFAAHHAAEGLPCLLPYSSPRVAPLAADAVLRLKKAHAPARAWLLAHPEAAAIGLVPSAVGKRGKERDAAEHALRLLAREGHEAIVMDVAARHGDEVRDAVRAALDFDPRDLFPAKMPKLPDFAAPTALPRPVLRESGKAIPDGAMENVLLAIAISRPDAPYQGLLDLKEASTPSSLAELSWELFQAWLVAGASSKESWAFSQLGVLGDDECARRLAPLVRAWPGESAHARAVAGLDVLAQIGTDVALMHLHGIAQKVKFKGMQEKAREKIDAIAEARGLSAEELADRLVPDLGLDEHGTLVLDFGPRSFRVGFDEALKPFVRDAANARLAELPKPRKDDDAEKAKAATDLWKALKKDAKTIAKQQVMRLELAMCGRRRWTDEVFRRFLVEHPLVRHLAVRLVWGVYDGDALSSTFRIAEDGTFADANDDAWTFPEGSTIGIPHALELGAEDAARFGQTFGDYEILQPFKQLGRETYALTEDEKKASTLTRWNDRVVPTGAVLGLESRGWRRGAPQDGGVSHWYEREVPGPDGSLLLSVDFEPGIIAGIATEWNEQKLHGVGVGVDWMWHKGASTAKLGELHPIVVSEIVRDMEALVSGSAA